MALRHVHVGEVSDRVRERVPVIVCRLVRPDLGCDDREVERDADRLDRRLDEVTVRVREDSEQPAAAARLLELVPGLGEHRPVRQRFGRIGIHAQTARRLAEHVAVAPSGLLGLDNGLELVVAARGATRPRAPGRSPRSSRRACRSSRTSPNASTLRAYRRSGRGIGRSDAASYDGPDARAARGRDRPPPARPRARGRHDRACGDRRPALTRPFDPAICRRRARRRADRDRSSAAASTSSSGWQRPHARRPSADDRLASVTPVPASSQTTRTGARRSTLDTGTEVAYRDVRRFGTWELLDADDVRPYLAARLGPEPLGPSFTRGTARCARGRADASRQVFPPRPERLAGIGNIYADEALWRVAHPSTAARGRARPGRVARLHRAIRAALRRGVELQGSTLSDYVTPGRRKGGMQHEFHVYGRLGEPCDRCGTPIERIVVGGRGTWFCPHCQRL